MSPLVQPGDCCILMIDPRREYMDRLDAPTRKTLAQNFDLVERAAQAAAVPIHLAFREPAPHPQTRLATSDSPAPSAVHNLGDSGSSWSDYGLAVALTAQARESLILCGFWIETSVTFIALPALASGFDVFIITDATPARVHDARRAAIDRLLQAGVVPTTTRQLVAEWIEAGAVQRSALSLLLPD